MAYDKFGINETKGVEGQYWHIDYPSITFNKSSFLKEWADLYVGSEINTIMDIGALDAGDSLRLCSWYPDAKIYTIEASPHNFGIINKKLDNKKPNIRTFNYAMSATNGFVDFYQTIYDDDSGVNAKYMVMGSIYDIIDSKKNFHNLKTIDTISVESITFDDFCEKNAIESVDVVHMDVEGATFSIILGMNKILKHKDSVCDVYVHDFIEANFKDKKLFLYASHPTSPIYVHMANQILGKLGLSQIIDNFDMDYAQTSSPTPIELPTSSVSHFNFTFTTKEEEVIANKYYRKIIADYINSKI